MADCSRYLTGHAAIDVPNLRRYWSSFVLGGWDITLEQEQECGLNMNAAQNVFGLAF